MKTSTLAPLTAVFLLAQAAAHLQAATVFSDNFDSETVGSNYTSFANWTVSDGTVDVVGPGFADLLPGNGRYVDLDGSSRNAGIMTSNLLTLSPGTYDLTYSLGGSQREDVNVVNVSLAGFAAAHTVPSSQGFIPLTLTFVTAGTISSIVIENLGGDNVGALLDNVVLARRDDVPVNGVPEGGATLALLGAALGVVELVRRRFAK